MTPFLSRDCLVRSGRCAPNGFGLFFLAFASLFWANRITAAEPEETPWEWTPYSICLHFEADRDVLRQIRVHDTAELAAAVMPRIKETARNWVGGLWTLDSTTGVFPDHLFQDNQLPETLTLQEPEIQAFFDSGIDKHIYIRITSATKSVRVESRELDMRTWTAFGRGAVEIENIAELPDAAFRVALQCFSPIANIEQVLPSHVILRIRGGEMIPPRFLPPESNSAASRQDAMLFGKGDVFVPFLRAWNKSGKIEAIKVIPWTALLVETVQRSRVECSTESGLRNPLGVRRRGRNEYVAILPHLGDKSTKLVVEPRAGTTGPPGNEVTPFLAKYGIFERTAENEKGILLGETDSHGEFVVSYTPETRIRSLLVRDGELLVAKLPLIQSWKAVYPIKVPDDETRIAAESVLMGIQEEVIDQITLRMILKARIEKYEAMGNTQGLAKAKSELERLKSREQFLTQLELERRKFSSPDPIVQMRLEKMFDTTQKIIHQYWK